MHFILSQSILLVFPNLLATSQRLASTSAFLLKKRIIGLRKRTHTTQHRAIARTKPTATRTTAHLSLGRNSDWHRASLQAQIPVPQRIKPANVLQAHDVYRYSATPTLSRSPPCSLIIHRTIMNYTHASSST